MYGLIGRIIAVAGKREQLAAILAPGDGGMPGCLSYIVAEDPENADALWITEVWTDPAAHRASLQLPAVQAAIAMGRPLIAGFDNRVETKVLGGIGVPRTVAANGQR
jgi:quinol monooxygenase YgiN